MTKFSWFNGSNIGNIKRLIVRSSKGREEWEYNNEVYIYRFKMRTLLVGENGFRKFCSEVGLNFYPDVTILEFNGKKHHYKYSNNTRKKMRLDYYSRNNIKIPSNDWLVQDFNKWNWFQMGMIEKIRTLSICYRDGRSFKFTKTCNGYFRYSKIQRMWCPCDGFAFCLWEIEHVVIEDFHGSIYMYDYTYSDAKRLKTI